MSYEGISLLAQDVLLRNRIVACLAVENANSADHPEATADLLRWRLATTPGWAEAYESALAEENRTTPPGADATVISDEMIANAVQEQLRVTRGL